MAGTLEDDERRLAADTLRDALHLSGLSAARLASRAGMSRALVRDYLLGAKQPSVAQLARLVRAADLEPVIELIRAYRPMALSDLGRALVDDASDGQRWRLLQEFLRGYGEAAPGERAALIAQEPVCVDPLWDALLGGVAEHLAFHAERPVPPWASDDGRFLDRWWFPGAVGAAGRTQRMMTAPAALAARGVWLERAALERAA